MARGSKDKYTEKQKRQARHIEEGYEERGVSEEEAERRAWATVNKIHGGGKNGAAAAKAKAKIVSRSVKAVARAANIRPVSTGRTLSGSSGNRNCQRLYRPAAGKDIRRLVGKGFPTYSTSPTCPVSGRRAG